MPSDKWCNSQIIMAMVTHKQTDDLKHIDHFLWQQDKEY